MGLFMNLKKQYLLLTILTISSSCMFAKGWFSNPEEDKAAQELLKAQKALLHIQLEKENIDLELKRRKLQIILEAEQTKHFAEEMEAAQQEAEQKSQEHRTQRILNACDTLSNPVPKSLKQRMHTSFSDLTDISDPGAANKIAWGPYAPTVALVALQVGVELISSPTIASILFELLFDQDSTTCTTNLLKKAGLYKSPQSIALKTFLQDIIPSNTTETEQQLIAHINQKYGNSISTLDLYHLQRKILEKENPTYGDELHELIALLMEKEADATKSKKILRKLGRPLPVIGGENPEENNAR